MIFAYLGGLLTAAESSPAATTRVLNGQLVLKESIPNSGNQVVLLRLDDTTATYRLLARCTQPADKQTWRCMAEVPSDAGALVVAFVENESYIAGIGGLIATERFTEIVRIAVPLTWRAPVPLDKSSLQVGRGDLPGTDRGDDRDGTRWSSSLLVASNPRQCG